MLKAFKILKNENEPTVEGIDYTILINVDHITSMKPINIPFGGNIIEGYWLRLLNGKKYKATRVPEELALLMAKKEGMAPMMMNGEAQSQTPSPAYQ